MRTRVEKNFVFLRVKPQQPVSSDGMSGVAPIPRVVSQIGRLVLATVLIFLAFMDMTILEVFTVVVFMVFRKSHHFWFC